MKSQLFAEVKEVTRLHHEKIETNPYAKAVEDGSITPEQYLEYLKKFYGFLAVTESSILNLSDGSATDQFLQSRFKAPLLMEDLKIMGVAATDMGSIPLCKNVPDLSTLPKVLGYMYVIEGSTLGGQIISRQIRKMHGDALPLNYFDCYGKETGKMWTAFCTFVDEKIKEEDKDDFLKSATDTFDKLDLWFNQ